MGSRQSSWLRPQYVDADAIVHPFNVVSALFGLFQGGIVPGYAMIVHETMPARQAATRVGTVIMASLFNMSFGG